MKTTLSIEESARLVELGVDAKLASHKESNWYNGISSEEFKVYHFFTLSDILSILPKEIGNYELVINGTKDEYFVSYILWDSMDCATYVRDNILVSARCDKNRDSKPNKHRTQLYSRIIEKMGNNIDGHVKTDKK